MLQRKEQVQRPVPHIPGSLGHRGGDVSAFDQVQGAFIGVKADDLRTGGGQAIFTDRLRNADATVGFGGEDAGDPGDISQNLFCRLPGVKLVAFSVFYRGDVHVGELL
ncbi:hypothetical protein D3C81_1093860 [compost metagenome]